MQPSQQCPATNIYPPFALSALGVGLSLVVAALALPAPVQAQQPMPMRDSMQGLLLLDLAAAPLGQSLNALAQQADVQILYAGTLTTGKHAPAVQGHYSVAEALRLLLSDSGLVASARDARTFIVTQQEDGSVQALDTVTVRGAASAVTEGSGSYTTGSTRSATKLDLSIRETPQSISVVTRQQMDDQSMRSLTDAVVATPGISLYGSGPRRLGFYARGFSIENVMTDGVPTAYSISLGAGLVADPDLSMYDHVEVVRGATGLMQGAGNPSASINLVRKRPTAERQVRLAVDAGSWDNYRSEADLSGRLNESGSVRGRAVAAYRNSGDFRDYVKHEYSTLYAIGEADLSTDTTLSAGFSWQNNRNDDSWGGLAAADASGRDLGLSRSTYLGNDWEYWNQKTSGVFADLEHRLDNGWALRMAATATQSRLDYLGTYLYRNEVTGGVNQSRPGGYIYKVRQHSYDAYASGPFELLGRSHELVAGLSSRRARTNTEGGSGGTVAENIDVENWDWHSIPRPETAITYTADNKREQNSFYLTTRLSLSEPLTMILGGRLDWYDYDDVQKGTGYKVTRNLTKYAGLVYDLDAQHSVYASYTDIFQPQGNYDVDGNLLDPVIGKNYEIGVKGEYFGGRLNASAALYRIEQERLAMLLADQAACPTYPTSSCYAASGLVRSQGIDLEIQGALTSSLELSAGYTWSDREYRKDADPSRIGQRYATYLPEHQFKLGMLYHLNDRWRVGGSMAWQSRIYEKDGNYDFVQKAYMVMNLMAGWRAAKSLEVQVNINNLFDKTYYTGIQGSSYPNQVYGAPRNVMLTARYGF